MDVLGISALYHDSAATLVSDGEIVSAAQEERFTRIKHDPTFPEKAIEFCLKYGRKVSEDLDAVVYYDNPLITMERLGCNLIYAGNQCEALVDSNLRKLALEKIFIKEKIQKALDFESDNIYAVKHHISHAASAFYPSPFREAAIITIDGVGEWTTTAIGYGNGNTLNLEKEILYPNSLGLLYSAFTWFCGFKVNSGDYKLMGLAPYGEPKYVKLIKEKLIDIKEDGSFKINLDYFDFQYGRTMTNDNFSDLFGGKRRTPEDRITQREADMASSVQKIVEEIVVKIARTASKIYSTENLCMAGGVALNCVANGVLQREKIFKNIWVQPASGDAGGSLGGHCIIHMH